MGTRSRSLWTLVVSPVIWAVHLLLSYVTAAVYCAKAAARDVALTEAQVAIALYTAAALAGIVVVGWRGWRRHGAGRVSLPHDADTTDSQRHFLGFTTFFLSVLSAVAVVFLALSVTFVGTCR